MDASKAARARHIDKLTSMYYYYLPTIQRGVYAAFSPGLATTSTPTPEIRRIARTMRVNSSDFRKIIRLFAFCLGVVTYPKEPKRIFRKRKLSRHRM